MDYIHVLTTFLNGSIIIYIGGELKVGYGTSVRIRDLLLISVIEPPIVMGFLSFLLTFLIIIIFAINGNIDIWIVFIGLIVLIIGIFIGIMLIPLIFVILLVFRANYRVFLKPDRIDVGTGMKLAIPYNSIRGYSIEYISGFFKKIVVDSKSMGALPSKVVWIQVDENMKLPFAIGWACKDRRIAIDVNDPEKFVNELNSILSMGAISAYVHVDNPPPSMFIPPPEPKP